MDHHALYHYLLIIIYFYNLDVPGYVFKEGCVPVGDIETRLSEIKRKLRGIQHHRVTKN